MARLEEIARWDVQAANATIVFKPPPAPFSGPVSGEEFSTYLRGDPEAFTALKSGVTGWNKWVRGRRKTDPAFRPNLNNLNLSDPEWQKTPLWRKSFPFGDDDSYRVCLCDGSMPRDRDFVGIDLSAADLWGANFENVYLPGAKFTGSRMYAVNLKQAYGRWADFTDVDLTQSSLQQADLIYAIFRGAVLFESEFVAAALIDCDFFRADLRHCDLRECRLESSNLTEAIFTNARIDNANVLGVEYDIRSMDGRYRGLGGIETTFGNAIWRRDALDQDYLDTLTDTWSAGIIERLRFPYGERSVLSTVVAYYAWPVVVLMLPFIVGWRRRPGRGSNSLLWRFATPFSFAYSLIFLGLGQGLPLFLWWLLDWGRSLWRVIIVAVIFVAIQGQWYANLISAGGLQYSSDLDVSLPTGLAFAPDWRPWFAAVMGFCTLGVTGLVKAVTSTAASAMVVNVVGGFVTLGLLISVAANKFARRS